MAVRARSSGARKLTVVATMKIVANAGCRGEKIDRYSACTLVDVMQATENGP